MRLGRGRPGADRCYPIRVGLGMPMRICSRLVTAAIVLLLWGQGNLTLCEAGSRAARTRSAGWSAWSAATACT